MIRSLAFAAALAALALPAATSAQDTGDPAWASFQQICWDTAGDYLGAVKAAGAGGWTDADLVANDDPAVSLTDKTAKSKTIGEAQMSVMITRGLRKMKSGAELKVSQCEVTSNKPDPTLLREGQAWVGVAPDSADPPDQPTLTVYFVKAAAGKPAHVGVAGSNAAMSSGGLGVLKFQQEKDSSILVYTVYTS
jgi:hypothetical protein